MAKGYIPTSCILDNFFLIGYVKSKNNKPFLKITGLGILVSLSPQSC